MKKGGLVSPSHIAWAKEKKRMNPSDRWQTSTPTFNHQNERLIANQPTSDLFVHSLSAQQALNFFLEPHAQGSLGFCFLAALVEAVALAAAPPITLHRTTRQGSAGQAETNESTGKGVNSFEVFFFARHAAERNVWRTGHKKLAIYVHRLEGLVLGHDLEVVVGGAGVHILVQLVLVLKLQSETGWSMNEEA